MEPYELTDEQRKELEKRFTGTLKTQPLQGLIEGLILATEQETRKKLLEWGYEDCNEHEHIHLATGEELIVRHFRCLPCMQPIFEAHGVAC